MKELELHINGIRRRVVVDADRSLLSVLHEDLDLTGAKYGCGEGQCGACTVLINGQPTRSCRTPVGTVAGKQVRTVESLAQNGQLHPLQDAFLEVGAMQCGYCIPGMIMSGVGLLEKNPHPTEPEIVRAMEGNVCRCGTYPRIVAAIRKAAADTHNQGAARRYKMTVSEDEILYEPERYELAVGPAYHFELARRDFLKVLGGGIFIVTTVRGVLAQEESGGARRGPRGGTLPQEIGAWLHIGEDGVVTAYTGKVEVGQDIRTSLSQAVAEELRAPLESVRLVMGDTELTPFDAGTFGSRTTMRQRGRGKAGHPAAGGLREGGWLGSSSTRTAAWISRGGRLRQHGRADAWSSRGQWI